MYLFTTLRHFLKIFDGFKSHRINELITALGGLVR